jgi:hypothetical protein
VSGTMRISAPWLENPATSIEKKRSSNFPLFDTCQELPELGSGVGKNWAISVLGIPNGYMSSLSLGRRREAACLAL